MSYIAIVDDEKDIRDILTIHLTNEKFKTKSFENGREFLSYILKENKLPDIVILDIMMDNINGYEVLKTLRKNYGNKIGIFFLTAKAQKIDISLGLDMGADDYITKPFHKEEIISRIKAFLRRHKKDDKEKSIYKYKDLEFYSEEKKLLIKNEQIKITKTEFNLLKLLTSSPQRIFSRDEILEYVWKDTIVNDRTIDVHITRLRNKLQDYKDIIKTHPGFGYSIEKQTDLI
ncbi:MAG TPA: response regulator transcription factor [Spirochaetota bacterium]|nr:response regulator transcription factor [Spirochaetota bacterium]HOM37841.1 response regulator transcription factor [Spirochaetota bacterium]HPQ49282.1 response regulator transcription factor [Spirochaetota bacterium]